MFSLFGERDGLQTYPRCNSQKQLPLSTAKWRRSCSRSCPRKTRSRSALFLVVCAFGCHAEIIFAPTAMVWYFTSENGICNECGLGDILDASPGFHHLYTLYPRMIPGDVPRMSPNDHRSYSLWRRFSRQDVAARQTAATFRDYAFISSPLVHGLRTWSVGKSSTRGRTIVAR